ncbi:heterokaryon incompatibility protein-domain-containing protein, partial [Paraphoma chrysanthemicola]
MLSKCNAVEANDKSKGQAQGFFSPADVVTELHAEPSSNDFVYEPLSHESDYIRVFKIHPGPSDARICCTMREEQISEAKYICLSYTWQPSHPEHTIEVDGRPLSVGENLYQFLHAYRAAQMHKVPQLPDEQADALWVDALSIDQKNIREKGHQIRQMGEIYKRATRVLIWLGVLADATKEALLAEHRIKSCFDAVRISNLSDHVLNLCAMTYWSRIWIAQEVILPSKDCLFLFDGDNCYDISLFYCYFDKLTRRFGVSTKSFGMSYFNWRRQERSIARMIGEKPSLSSLLFYLAGCGCQDVRDRIFALLPLAKSNILYLEYDLDANHLFRAVFEQAIGNEPMDDIMSLGALLIEALQIRGPYSGSNQDSSSNSSNTSD